LNNLKAWVIEYDYGKCNRKKHKISTSDSMCEIEEEKSLIPINSILYLTSIILANRDTDKCCQKCKLIRGCHYFSIISNRNKKLNCSFFRFSDQSDNFKQSLLVGKFYEENKYPESIIGFDKNYLFDPNDW
jgi:hypothetical protein